MTAVIRMAVPALALASLLAAPRPAAAQVNCGTTSVSHSMRQTPGYARSVDVSASTSRPINTCPLEVQTEAWVDSLSTAYINSSRQLYSAAVSFTRAVPAFGTWHSTAKHWLIWFASGTWNNLGNTYAQALVAQGTYTCRLTASDCASGLRVQALALCVRRSQSHPDRHGR